ncbi:MFS transporter [Vibrio sp. Isolate31]|uniref:MFS transporter n=1 Tax=unclassified Vibrio TaxID=2614977 RepID=UPI001EFC39C3|nr:MULTISPECIES: MFS transporter [unclassified Vibrio]MCG9554667.1 MFS transporter [Vibrio sp. Isolate32]MCG9600055.1 MFS transporter [Vibrio sp. Isolate31]
MSVTQNKTAQLGVVGLAAALMGIGQNGLLVSLPFLVEKSAFSLSTWSILIAVGSLLFLPSAPYWGRYSDLHGPKIVVVRALAGMALSFSLLSVFAFVSHTNEALVSLCLVGLLLARMIYGCTVSGMVPASQHWTILLCGEENRLQAITSVSIGLSAGRLIGPLISILVLKLSPYAPLMVMVALPCVALVAAMMLPSPSVEEKTQAKKESLPWLPQRKLLPYLFSGLLLCAAIALLQYSFSPLIGSVTQWNTGQISDAIGVLLTISAACTFVTQVIVIKKKKLTPLSMYRIGSVLLLVGFALFLTVNIWVFGVAMTLAASGAALLVPAYTSSATEQQRDYPGAVAGYISMFHTIGYGVASLMAVTATISANYPIYLCITFSAIIVLIAYLAVNRQQEKEIKTA